MTAKKIEAGATAKSSGDAKLTSVPKDQPVLNIDQALTAVMREIPVIGKDSRNTEQNYSFRSVDAIVNELHKLFAKYGVRLAPRVLEADYDRQVTNNGKVVIDARLLIEYQFIAEDGSWSNMIVQGEARDWADKATNKAMQAALKYGLAQAFLIPTDDTEDADAVTHEIEVEQAPRPPSMSEDEIGERMQNAAKKRIYDLAAGDAERATVAWSQALLVLGLMPTDALNPDELKAVEAQAVVEIG